MIQIEFSVASLASLLVSVVVMFTLTNPSNTRASTEQEVV